VIPVGLKIKMEPDGRVPERVMEKLVQFAEHAKTCPFGCKVKGGPSQDCATGTGIIRDLCSLKEVSYFED